MTVDHTDCPMCVVCRCRIAVGESYFIRFLAKASRAMHQHPASIPARERDALRPRAA